MLKTAVQRVKRLRRILSHPAHPELRLAALARWYIEPLSDARTRLAAVFSILLGGPGMLSKQ